MLKDKLYNVKPTVHEMRKNVTNGGQMKHYMLLRTGE